MHRQRLLSIPIVDRDSLNAIQWVIMKEEALWKFHFILYEIKDQEVGG